MYSAMQSISADVRFFMVVFLFSLFFLILGLTFSEKGNTIILNTDLFPLGVWFHCGGFSLFYRRPPLRQSLLRQWLFFCSS